MSTFKITKQQYKFLCAQALSSTVIPRLPDKHTPEHLSALEGSYAKYLDEMEKTCLTHRISLTRADIEELLFAFFDVDENRAFQGLDGLECMAIYGTDTLDEVEDVWFPCLVKGGI